MNPTQHYVLISLLNIAFLCIWISGFSWIPYLLGTKFQDLWSPFTLMTLLVLLAWSLIVWIAGSWLMAKIPAECPNCKSMDAKRIARPGFHKGHSIYTTVVYQCSRCKHVHDTGLSTSSSSSSGNDTTG